MGGRLAAALIAAMAGLVGAALWAQVIEGSPRLLRPYGYYGGLLGACAGALAAPLVGTDIWLVLGAYAVAGPFIQAAGRLRCLVQGCCHGSPAPSAVGIRYAHPRSRVCRLSDLGGKQVHPTQVYSILWNGVIALATARLWSVHAGLHVVGGVYLILNGAGRFVEEAYRGEPQTPVYGNLRLYQWVAIGSVLAGIAVTALGRGGPAPAPSVHVAAIALGLAFGLLTWFALGVDFPRSSARFSRLV
jgi:prolipoprotein diacylglyceryltransferase